MSFVFLKKSKCCKIKNKYFFEKFLFTQKQLQIKDFKKTKKNKQKMNFFISTSLYLMKGKDNEQKMQ